MKEALSTINKGLIENLKGLITLIYSSGLIRVDFADVKTILAGWGRLAYLNNFTGQWLQMGRDEQGSLP